MERERQFKNVAFGGDWSDQIVVREKVQAALAILERAVADSFNEDPCRPEVIEALEVLCARIARGQLQVAAWRRAGGIVAQGTRWHELARVLETIKSGVGVAARSPSTDDRPQF